MGKAAGAPVRAYASATPRAASALAAVFVVGFWMHAPALARLRQGLVAISVLVAKFDQQVVGVLVRVDFIHHSRSRTRALAVLDSLDMIPGSVTRGAQGIIRSASTDPGLAIVPRVVGTDCSPDRQAEAGERGVHEEGCRENGRFKHLKNYFFEN